MGADQSTLHPPLRSGARVKDWMLHPVEASRSTLADEGLRQESDEASCRSDEASCRMLNDGYLACLPWPPPEQEGSTTASSSSHILSDNDSGHWGAALSKPLQGTCWSKQRPNEPEPTIDEDQFLRQSSPNLAVGAVVEFGMSESTLFPSARAEGSHSTACRRDMPVPTLAPEPSDATCKAAAIFLRDSPSPVTSPRSPNNAGEYHHSGPFLGAYRRRRAQYLLDKIRRAEEAAASSLPTATDFDHRNPQATSAMAPGKQEVLLYGRET